MTERTPEEFLMHERLLTWDIREGDNVIVIGGYQGTTCKFILERYPWCNLYTWEPQEAMYKILVEALKPWPNAHAYNYGLGNKTAILPMIKMGSDFCSFVTEYAHHEVNVEPNGVGGLREFGEVMDELGIQEVAWMHLNIEGYEYILLPHLVRTGWIKRIGQLVLATHDSPKDGSESCTLEEIAEMVEETHDLYWWRQRQFCAWSRPDRKKHNLQMPTSDVPASALTAESSLWDKGLTR